MAEPEWTSQGTIDVRGHRIWWASVGDEHDDRPPLLTVHGGPGICHDCLEPLAALADERRVVFYDQYGCGYSDRAADPAEYDIDLFTEEIDAVRSALGLDRTHLYAHSYGGPLAIEYLLRRNPSGLVSLVLSNTFDSTQGLAAGWSRRLAELPDGEGDVLHAGPGADQDAYFAALGDFIQRFILPGEPPEALMRSQQKSGAEVYERMHGTSWFEPNGAWSDWDPGDRLASITVPTLVIGGERDQCVPEMSEALHRRIPGSSLVVLDAGHLPFFETPDRYLGTIRDFLQRTDAPVPAA